MRMVRLLIFIIIGLSLFACARNVPISKMMFNSGAKSLTRQLPYNIQLDIDYGENFKTVNKHPSGFVGSATSINVEIGDVFKSQIFDAFDLSFNDVYKPFDTKKYGNLLKYRVLIDLKDLDYSYSYSYASNKMDNSSAKMAAEVFVYRDGLKIYQDTKYSSYKYQHSDVGGDIAAIERSIAGTIASFMHQLLNDEKFVASFE